MNRIYLHRKRLFLFTLPPFLFLLLAGGSTTGFARTVDIALHEEDAAIFGASAGGNMTQTAALSSGDMNGDGVGDIIMGAFRANAAYILFGPFSSGSRVDMKDSPPDVVVYGADPADYTGFSVCAGDISGDGSDDLVIGALEGDGPANSLKGAGEVHVLFGPFASGTLIELRSRKADVTIYGGGFNDEFGYAVEAGDVTGDGIKDLAVSAVAANGPSDSRPEAGDVHVFFGPFASGTEIDLGTAQGDVTIYGAEWRDFLGWSLAINDVTGDHIGDLVFSAPNEGVGEVHVLFGPLASGTVVDLKSDATDLVVYPLSYRDGMGVSVAARDVTGDGMGDLILGAFSYDGLSNTRFNAGGVYILFGPFMSGTVVDLGMTPPDVLIYGAEAEDRLGWFVEGGDVTGDGIDDLLMSAPAADGPTNARSDAGESYVIHGPFASGTKMDMATTEPDLAVFAADPLDRLAPILASDVTGDAIQDVILGAWWGDGPSEDRLDAGEAYVIFGRSQDEDGDEDEDSDEGEDGDEDENNDRFIERYRMMHPYRSLPIR